MAIGTNSPTLLGKRLWSETRIALFMITGAVLIATLLVARAIVTSRFGRVLAADHIDDDPAPLLYFRGGYAGLGDEPPAPEPPAPPVEVRLPTELGDLRVTHLGDEDPSRVSVAG